MNVKQALSIPVLCAGLLLSGQVLADSIMHSTPENATKFYPVPVSGRESAQQIQNEFDEFKRNPFSADGLYRYVDGEQGWEPNPHEMLTAMKHGCMSMDFSTTRLDPT